MMMKWVEIIDTTHYQKLYGAGSINPAVLGAAVIKGGIVVNSSAYLQGLWKLIRRNNPATTWEQRLITTDSLSALSNEYDAVIVAAGPGVNELWTEGEVVPSLSFNRGQNLEFLDDGGGSGKAYNRFHHQTRAHISFRRHNFIL
jgi:glycine/D-amino acid oxidase-like deaminating enzyme